MNQTQLVFEALLGRQGLSRQLPVPTHVQSDEQRTANLENAAAKRARKNAKRAQKAK